MKFIYWFIAVVALAACESYRYPDYTGDFDNTAVYFPFQDLERTLVYNEFDHIQVGVQMGGRRENSASEWVSYEIDNSIVAEAGLTLMPEAFYTLSDDAKFNIEPGRMEGELTLSVTQDFFDNSDDTDYYIPFRLLTTSLDSILDHKQTMILTLKVEAAKFGNYYHNGVLRVDSLSGSQSTVAYHQEEPVTTAVNNWVLSSAAHDTLLTSGIANQLAGANDYSFKMHISADNTVNILPNATAVWAVSADGISSYNPDKKEFYLNYKYQDATGNDCSVTDTLIYRNRVLDGANQWW